MKYHQAFFKWLRALIDNVKYDAIIRYYIGK